MPDGRRILIGWMASWQGHDDHPPLSLSHALTLPRELGLARSVRGGELVLTQHPVREFYASELNRENEVLLTLRPGTTGKSGLRGVVELGYDADRRTLFVDNVHAPVQLVDGEGPSLLIGLPLKYSLLMSLSGLPLQCIRSRVPRESSSRLGYRGFEWRMTCGVIRIAWGKLNGRCLLNGSPN